MTLRYLSLFSGIEAASVAWRPLGWKCVGVAEIERFPSDLLKHHYPDVPNLGDITQITEEMIKELGPLDLVVFGSPCQDLSVAGNRKGLAGARSGLFFAALQIIGWARKWCGCRFALWENVPGAFSSNKGADFAAVVDALAGLEGTPVPPKGWGTEGCAVGAEAMVEWSTLDAQWFGVAQRRRRVFALADFGDWSRRPPILLEPDSMRGDTAPSRKARQEIAGALTSSAGGSDENDAANGRLVAQQRSVLIPIHEVAGTLDASYDRLMGCSGQDASRGHSHLVAFGGNNTSAALDVSPALLAHPGSGYKGDFETETFLVTPRYFCVCGEVFVDPFATRVGGLAPAECPKCGNDEGIVDRWLLPTCVTGRVTHALTGEGFDASEDGTGRGTPLVATGWGSWSEGDALRIIPFDTTQITHPANRSNPKVGDPCHPLAASAHAPAIAFPANLSGTQCASEVDLSPALGALNPTAVAFSSMHVRRLIPVECERLQDFPDNYTNAPSRGKPAADGPRYKALGNSMCVSVMHWIGHQIDFAWRFF